ncbi:MAG: flagellar biosynthesis protein FlhF [Burkholderiaceae bacterium]|nr:flagellar biosynthesis protein FlhF [Burkholderiaceae bacterium]
MTQASNIKRFTARTSREALALVREALGDDAVVLSTRPAPEGVEVLAMAPEGLQQIEQAAARLPATQAPSAAVPASAPRRGTLAERIAARGEPQRPQARVEPRLEPRLEPRAEAAEADIDDDVGTLGMSTLSFQDYVRERMLRRRQSELERQAGHSGQALAAGLAATEAARRAPQLQAQAAQRQAAEPPPAVRGGQAVLRAMAASHALDAQEAREAQISPRTAAAAVAPAGRRQPPRSLPALPVLREEILLDDLPAEAAPRPLPAASRRAAAALHDGAADSDAMLGELRSVRSLIEERFGMLAFMEKLQRNPKQVALAQQLFDTGLSPGLVRKLVQQVPVGCPDDLAWATQVLERNVITDEGEAPIEDHAGVFALIGPTGVGKTTSCAKIAAAFATKYGASQLGLITLDAYRVGAHEQLRAYGRILGVPVHTAHDRASLEDLLELLQGKKLVLIDTAGMAQRDARTRELLDMLSHPAIRKLLVVNAAAQGETVEDVMANYEVSRSHGVVLSKLDEAVKLGPALDALIRHRARIVGVANGQRVPEDWHRLSAQALVQRALRGGGSATWRLDADDVNLLMVATHASGRQAVASAAAGLHA